MTSVSDPDPANGNYLVLDLDRDWNPETGFTTRYLHLDELLVTNGQSVKRGQQIGWMGSTGIDKNGNSTSTPKHLHFGLRYNNDGSSSRPEVTYVTMEGWLLKSFQTECSERTLRIHWATTSGTTVSSNTITAGAP
jgi:murein DD-endopeptidase MepM/ murein hydrolase activator NlpD